MTLKGQGEGERVDLETHPGSAKARFAVMDSDLDSAAISLDANQLRVLASMATAAALELERRAVSA